MPNNDDQQPKLSFADVLQQAPTVSFEFGWMTARAATLSQYTARFSSAIGDAFEALSDISDPPGYEELVEATDTARVILGKQLGSIAMCARIAGTDGYLARQAREAATARHRPRK